MSPFDPILPVVSVGLADGRSSWKKALSRAEMPGDKNRSNDKEDDHNTANDSDRSRVTFKLGAKPVPALMLAHCRRDVNNDDRKPDQEYEGASFIDQSMTEIHSRSVRESNDSKNLKYDDCSCRLPIRQTIIADRSGNRS
jgi:hypothetical protein